MQVYHVRRLSVKRILIEILNNFFSQIINPLCEYLETDLRLQVHSHLQLDDRNPFRGGVNDASGFLDIPPLLLGEKYINIKAKVEAYLEKTFYNLTTVALHNWRTYGEMRAMATHNYKVGNTVEEILRIQNFVIIYLLFSGDTALLKSSERVVCIMFSLNTIGF